MLKYSSSNISVSKKEGILDIGKSEQIICAFCIQVAKYYKEQMILSYDEREAPIIARGKSMNDDVKLSEDQIELDGAYILLHSQSTISIDNSSGRISYVW